MYENDKICELLEKKCLADRHYINLQNSELLLYSNLRSFAKGYCLLEIESYNRIKNEIQKYREKALIGLLKSFIKP